MVHVVVAAVVVVVDREGSSVVTSRALVLV